MVGIDGSIIADSTIYGTSMLMGVQFDAHTASDTLLYWHMDGDLRFSEQEGLAGWGCLMLSEKLLKKFIKKGRNKDENYCVYFNNCSKRGCHRRWYCQFGYELQKRKQLLSISKWYKRQRVIWQRGNTFAVSCTVIQKMSGLHLENPLISSF